jgi:carboxyl-terminal processing protease
MKRIYLLPLVLLFVSFYFSSCKEDEIPAQTLLVNKWIQQEMNIYYFWNEQMPKLKPNSYPDPKLFFNRLLYKDDRFSWITDDAQSLLNQLDGNDLSMGFSPSFGRIDNTNNVFMAIEFVYKGSPADLAGLKRGDIILSINDIDLNVTNYRTLYRQNAYTVTLGQYTSSGGLVKTTTKKSLTAVMLEKNPVLHYEVLDYDGKMIGYLAYAEFISGDDNRWLNKLREALVEMKNDGAAELIVDLRYNPGGQMRVAGFLASAIAPPSVSNSNSVLVRMKYNNIVNDYFVNNQGYDSENLVYKFPGTTVNLDLSRVVFLTTEGSASASELLINGLEPYMEVFQIGEPTFGKFYGSIVMRDEDEPPSHTYAMMPLIMKYENAVGFSDFINGLIPDYQIEDNLFNAKPFGDLNDPMLAAAVRYLSDQEMPARVKPTVAPYVKLPDIDRLRRGNIMFKD